jgi:uncharacterized phage protein (TIGR01671 family)
MREIKFRAWDNKNNKMYYDCGAAPLIVCYSSIWVEYLTFDKVIHINHELPELIPMQYTGLRDRNGIRIFEGDIVADGKRWISKVEIIESCGCCETILGFDKSLEVGEVIGNIYQHSELLEINK